MEIQILITTMHAVDFSKIEQMNLRNVSAILANQTDYAGYEEHSFPERKVAAALVSTTGRGTSLNRNTALVYASGDVLVFADDDMIFADGFARMVERDFLAHPDADAIKYYCESTNPDRKLAYHRPKAFKLGKKTDLMSAGVPALAVKKEFLDRNGLCFRNAIGPGRALSFGEDSVFYSDFFRSKPRIYQSPELAAYVSQGESTWFRGYDRNYFLTVGNIYRILYGRLALLAGFRRALRFSRKADVTDSFGLIFQWICQGIRQGKSGCGGKL